MTWQLSRGGAGNPAQDCRLHITSHQSGNYEVPTLLWSQGPMGQVQAQWISEKSYQSLSVQALENLWQCQTPDGSLVVFGCLAWGRLPSLELLLKQNYPRIYYVPLRGWYEDRWHDGPLLWIQNAEALGYVLPGAPSLLRSGPLLSGSNLPEWIAQKQIIGWKHSLGWAMREKFQALPDRSYLLEGLDSKASHALVLLGLRLAFPDLKMICLERPLAQGPQWKRLCQNLNIATWAAPSVRQGALAFAVEDAARFWCSTQAQTFLASLQSHVPILPDKLWRELLGLASGESVEKFFMRLSHP